MRLLFAGNPAIAVPSLEVCARLHELVGVLSSPTKSVGRGRRAESSPVVTAAKSLGVPVLQLERLDGTARATVADLAPELLVVFAYGRIFGPKFISLFPRGGINVHPSLLPKHRGPSPIPAAILAGDEETGISIQALAAEMDTGDILAQSRIALDGTETTESLTSRCALAGAEVLAAVLGAISEGSESRLPQDHSAATYCRLLTKEDGRIDWTRPASFVERQVRAYNPWPLAHTKTSHHGLLFIHRAVPSNLASPPGTPPGTVFGVDKSSGILVQTGDGVLALSTVQLEAKKHLDAAAFLNGQRDFIGTVLGGNG